MIRIVEVGDIAWQGVTKPIFCRGDDGCEYVVKGKENAGFRSLIAEWVAARLGRMIGLPIPPVEQMKIVPELFDFGADRDKLVKLGRGTLFGSRRIPNVTEVRDPDVKRVDLRLRARVLAFDWWIANSDRVFVHGCGNPNLLWAEDDEALFVIDHNLAFRPEDMDDIWANHAFREARAAWTPAFRHEMSEQFRESLSNLQVVWNELPDEWTEFDDVFTLAHVESILWKFDWDAANFWSPP